MSHRLIVPSGVVKPVGKVEDTGLGVILKAFQVTGARLGAQVGALAIRAFHEALTGPQPTLYWRMADCPRQVRDIVPADTLARAEHVALVSAGVEPPWWVPSTTLPTGSGAPLHLRTDDGTHVWVW